MTGAWYPSARARLAVEQEVEPSKPHETALCDRRDLDHRGGPGVPQFKPVRPEYMDLDIHLGAIDRRAVTTLPAPGDLDLPDAVAVAPGEAHAHESPGSRQRPAARKGSEPGPSFRASGAPEAVVCRAPGPAIRMNSAIETAASARSGTGASARATK